MAPMHARLLLGATYKVGKTSLLGAWAPKTTLIVDTQKGSLLLEGEHFVVHVHDWPTFVRVVNDICAGGHTFHTIGLDLANDLWRFCDLYHGKVEDGIRTPASGVDDYQRSIKRAVAAFNQQVGRLLAAPVGIWFITHLRERMNIKGELLAYVPDMDKNVHAYIAGAVDFLWLAESVNGQRQIHTQPTKHFEAGSRRPIPSPLPMDAVAVAVAMDRALNPDLYDAEGNRKVAEKAPTTVPATAEHALEVASPEQRDIERTGRSDLEPPPDPTGLSSVGVERALAALLATDDEHFATRRGANARMLALGAKAPQRLQELQGDLDGLAARLDAAVDSALAKVLALDDDLRSLRNVVDQGLAALHYLPHERLAELRKANSRAALEALVEDAQSRIKSDPEPAGSPA